MVERKAVDGGTWGVRGGTWGEGLGGTWVDAVVWGRGEVVGCTMGLLAGVTAWHLQGSLCNYTLTPYHSLISLFCHPPSHPFSPLCSVTHPPQLLVIQHLLAHSYHLLAHSYIPLAHLPLPLQIPPSTAPTTNFSLLSQLHYTPTPTPTPNTLPPLTSHYTSTTLPLHSHFHHTPTTLQLHSHHHYHHSILSPFYLSQVPPCTIPHPSPPPHSFLLSIPSHPSNPSPSINSIQSSFFFLFPFSLFSFSPTTTLPTTLPPHNPIISPPPKETRHPPRIIQT